MDHAAVRRAALLVLAACACVRSSSKDDHATPSPSEAPAAVVQATTPSSKTAPPAAAPARPRTAIRIDSVLMHAPRSASSFTSKAPATTPSSVRWSSRATWWSTAVRLAGYVVNLERKYVEKFPGHEATIQQATQRSCGRVSCSPLRSFHRARIRASVGCTDISRGSRSSCPSPCASSCCSSSRSRASEDDRAVQLQSPWKVSCTVLRARISVAGMVFLKQIAAPIDLRADDEHGPRRRVADRVHDRLVRSRRSASVSSAARGRALRPRSRARKLARPMFATELEPAARAASEAPRS
jgi:hypothetical protein